jgi:predicted transcriptional regulator YdeE
MKEIFLSLFILMAAFSLSAECQNQGENEMASYKIVQKPAMLVIGIECRTSNSPDAAQKDIPLHWERFISEEICSKIPNKSSNDILGLYCDYAGDFTQPYSLVIGCQVTSSDEIPPGMVAKTLPASSYAVFQVSGEFPKSVVDTWGTIWQTSLPRTYTGDFERYGENFYLDNIADIYIAIE